MLSIVVFQTINGSEDVLLIFVYYESKQADDAKQQQAGEGRLQDLNISKIKTTLVYVHTHNELTCTANISTVHEQI